MELGARQVLLAASIFGRTFRAAGVKALWTPQGDDALERHLQQLVAQELVEPLPDSPLSSGGEFRFRHALMREAAYGLVPESHRPTAHQLAGAWLEQQGELDVLMLATHYQLGQQLERAAACYTLAAEQHFERHDLQGTMRCVEGALACGVKGEARSRLLALQAVVLFWMDQMPRAVEIGGSVLNALKAGSPLWCRLMGSLMIGYLLGGHQERAARAVESLLRTSPEPEAIAAYAEALFLIGGLSIYAGLRQQAEVALSRIVEVCSTVMEHDALVRGWMGFLKAPLLCFFEASPWQAYLVAEQVRQDFSSVGMERNVQIAQTQTAFALAALGEVPGAVELLRKNLADIRRTELQFSISHVHHLLTHVLLNSPDSAHQREGLAVVHEWNASEGPDDFRRGVMRALLAKALMIQGEPEKAETHARQACEFLTSFPTHGVYARTVLSNVLLGQGRATEARQVAVLGVRELEQMRSEGVFAVAVHLTLADACFAEGDTGAGEAALREALRCVHVRASDIPEAAARERFLRQVPENARTLELARQRWGEATV
jgi:tetratricopeptide (TPR) repeat protein